MKKWLKGHLKIKVFLILESYQNSFNFESCFIRRAFELQVDSENLSETNSLTLSSVYDPVFRTFNE